MCKEHNGWRNYPTWCVRTWCDDLGYEEDLRRIISHSDARGYTLADTDTAVRDYVMENVPELDDLAGDLLGWAFEAVHWSAIADYYRENAQ